MVFVWSLMKVVGGMFEVPKFRLYGDGDPEIEEALQSTLGLRAWGELTVDERKLAFEHLVAKKCISSESYRPLRTAEHLNQRYLRQCLCKRLHFIDSAPSSDHSKDHLLRTEAAYLDIQDIFICEKSDVMVLRMLTMWLSYHIKDDYISKCASDISDKEKERYLSMAYKEFDAVAKCLNHIFEQFSVNQFVTRTGFIPRQDYKITKDIYVPTLTLLADPKWKSVSDDLAKMFEDYGSGDFAAVIAKAHCAVQRFLQILVGEEGKNGKGAFGKLYSKAKKERLFGDNQFSGRMINVISTYIPSERANNSTAKPSQKEASSTDALLMMNVVMVLLQHCLQNIK